MELVLGLDSGTASVGWALVETRAGTPAGLRAAGVRAFDAGVEGDISAGRDSSRAAARRAARLRRRLLARRRHRLTKLAVVLQRAGLLPPGNLESGGGILSYLAALDRELFTAAARRKDPHRLLYRLRARALDEELAPYELGRALYHLAHRRGFLSSRRVRPTSPGARATEEEKEEGKVKQAIGELAQRMRGAGARTLGEYLAGLDPEEGRVRGRYLGRQMLEEEFEHIWAAQRQYRPEVLTDDLKRRVEHAIFFQRPLKSQRARVGECELERGRRRAPWASPAAQRFRLLQRVNDLWVDLPDGSRRPLSEQERAPLIAALEENSSLTFGSIRSLLGMPRGARFNFETEGEKRLVGDRMAHALRAVFGAQRWAELTPEQRERVVEDLRSVHSLKALRNRGTRVWGLDQEAAARFAEVRLEDGYCRLSRQALARILPLMEQGVPYATARQQVYHAVPHPRPCRLLPPLEHVMEVRNPAVERALTELRKVVNAIVREYGRPDRIRIELARDLKRPRKQREEIAARMARNRNQRERAREEVIRQAGIPNPRPSDIEKWILAEECNWTCPYTGRGISVEALFGDQPQFDVEHIIPFRRCLDDSFMNKTLCEVAENRARKGNRTPWEAYGYDPDRWAEIEARVRAFRGDARQAKLKRFRMRELGSVEEFASSQLNDTRYASRLAAAYVGRLYGAGAEGVDPEGTRRVEASRGAVTAFLRSEWQLDSILGGGEKTRDDHRQHAIDAVVTALTTPEVIKRLSEAASGAPEARRRRFAPLEPPWAGFLDDVRRAVEGMVTSHRVARKVAAALHEETIYSKPKLDEQGMACVHVRKPLRDLSPRDIGAIVDPAVRACVMAKLEELGQPKPARAFADEANLPALQARDGRAIPIKRVRVRAHIRTEEVGSGPRARHVKLGSNHHLEILEVTDRQGRPRWLGEVVSTLEAMRRLRAGEPVVQRDHGPGKRFLFSLAGDEIIELDAEENEREDAPGQRGRARYVVRTVTKDQQGRASIEFCGINDARKKDEIKRTGDWGRSSIDGLRKRHCRKVLVTPLGEVRRAGD